MDTRDKQSTTSSNHYFSQPIPRWVQVSMGASGSVQLPGPSSDICCDDSESYEFTLPAVVLVGGPAMAAGEMVSALELRVSVQVPEADDLPWS